MAFNNMNGFNNQNNNNGEPKQKKNFKVDRLRSVDGELNLGIWDSDMGGTLTSISIKAAVGKDPTTGRAVYEQKSPNELPSVLLGRDFVRALIMAMKDTTPENANITIQPGEGKAKLTLKSTSNGYSITLDHPKNGSRTMNMQSIPIGGKNYHPTWARLLEGLIICDKATSYGKLDKDRFNSALSGGTDDEDTPF